MHSLNWDNLRFVLAVADHGSVSAASRVLGVNHATVLRRVAAFEADHGGEVFEKTATGYVVRADRLRVIDAGREVENAVYSVERLMHGARAPLRGVVRLSSTDSICQFVLPPLVARLQASSPDLQVELLSSNRHVDVARLQADISIRPTHVLPDDMTGDTSASLTFRAYATPGAPETWLGLTGPLARTDPAVWMAKTIARDDMHGASDSFVVLCEMARLGMGQAVLPAFIGDRAPDLEWRRDAMPETHVPIWVGTHSELKDVPRIRLAQTHVLNYLAECADMLWGVQDP